MARWLGGIAILLILGSIINFFVDRSTLGPSQDGTKTEWTEYVERSEQAVADINVVFTSPEQAETSAFLGALTSLADSPDPTLNRTARDTHDACLQAASTCGDLLADLAEQYNRALQEAEDDGLLKIGGPTLSGNGL